MAKLREQSCVFISALIFAQVLAPVKAYAFFSAITMAVGGAFLSNQVANDAQRVIGRAEHLVNVANMDTKDRLNQINLIIADTDKRVERILTNAGVLIDGRIAKIDKLTSDIQNKIDEVLKSAKQNILDVEAKLVADLDHLFDRADQVVLNVDCTVVRASISINSTAAALKEQLSNVSIIVKQPGVLGLMVGNDLSAEIMIDDKGYIDKNKFVPRVEYEKIRDKLYSKLHDGTSNSTREIMGIYADLQYLAGTFRCLQFSGVTTTFYIRDFLEAGESYRNWEWIAFGN